MLFIGTQFSNLYTAVDTSARGRVGTRTFLKVYMELGSSFLFLQEQIKDIIIIFLSQEKTLHVPVRPPSAGLADQHHIIFHSFSFGKFYNVLYPRRHLYLYNILENIFLKINF